jgi:hypothetical protein
VPARTRRGRSGVYGRFPGSVKAASRATKKLTRGGILAPDESLPDGGQLGERVPMGPQARREYAAKMSRRYRAADRAERGRLLDEFTAVTGMHRKYAIALLGRDKAGPLKRRGRPSRFRSDVVSMLVGIWRAADYPWSRRLHSMLPLWLPSARTTLDLTSEIETLLLGMSPRTMDRLLRPHRVALRRRIYGRTKPGTLLKHNIPIRTERWNVNEAGWCEIDTVVHCGESAEGEFANSVNLTDVASTWTETRAVLGKGKRHIVEAPDAIRLALPFRLRGLDSDTGSEFINHRCVEWCHQHGLQFTRSRPYHKNDNAHVEQKNWDPFALVATVQDKVAAILAAPSKPVEKRRGRPPAPPAFTKAGLERNARLEEAPVRSYVAR